MCDGETRTAGVAHLSTLSLPDSIERETWSLASCCALTLAFSLQASSCWSRQDLRLCRLAAAKPGVPSTVCMRLTLHLEHTAVVDSLHLELHLLSYVLHKLPLESSLLAARSPGQPLIAVQSSTHTDNWQQIPPVKEPGELPRDSHIRVI